MINAKNSDAQVVQSNCSRLYNTPNIIDVNMQANVHHLVICSTIHEVDTVLVVLTLAEWLDVFVELAGTLKLVSQLINWACFGQAIADDLELPVSFLR